MTNGKAIKISINALGGQGGGVLSNWIVALGESAGYIAQSTSVPGVAQRTGATVYYVELFPQSAAQAKGKPPVLGLMPASGDVDVVIASELMEAGRALSRGLISSQTTLIASTHRVYAIGEKIAMGDARQKGDAIIKAVKAAAGDCVFADMDMLANDAQTIISAVLFGALASSGALPISREKFEATILASGRAVEQNLAGFNAGFLAASTGATNVPHDQGQDEQISDGLPAPAVKPLLKRLESFPSPAHFYMREGLKKVVDFQDVAYGDLYLDRLSIMRDLDEAHGGVRRDWALLKSVAKHLALWMTYEDVVRVADLKTRASRFRRFRDDVRAADGQIVEVAEYMHPRVEEICDILPRWLARGVLGSSVLRGVLKKILGGGRRVSTTKLRGFLMLNALGSLRVMRRASYRYGIEQQRINAWLQDITIRAETDYRLACEVAGLQRLLKGYGDTFERGLGNFQRIIGLLGDISSRPNAASALRLLRDAALGDEEGAALSREIAKLGSGIAQFEMESAHGE